MKTTVRYPGQKKIAGVYQAIINEIPPYKTFIEGFAGSAQISRLLLSSGGTYVLNDLDGSGTDDFDCSGQGVKRFSFDINDLLFLCRVFNTDAFLFLDPPYLHSTRPSNTKLYKFEMSVLQHKKFLLSVRSYSGKCLIIHPKCDLYDNELKGWRTRTIKIRYHGKTSIETLYMNYDKPSTLQLDSYLGDQCWDRQRIKRKSDSLIAKMSALPSLERQYVLSRLFSKFDY